LLLFRVPTDLLTPSCPSLVRKSSRKVTSAFSRESLVQVRLRASLGIPLARDGGAHPRPRGAGSRANQVHVCPDPAPGFPNTPLSLALCGDPRGEDETLSTFFGTF
jgi:hypothetical protein